MPDKIEFKRFWSMPTHKTFEIKPFAELIKFELGDNYIDPFPYPYKQDAIDYLKTIPDNSENFLVFDPPYSQRQLKEMYSNNGLAFLYSGCFGPLSKTNLLRPNFSNNFKNILFKLISSNLFCILSSLIIAQRGILDLFLKKLPGNFLLLIFIYYII